jgi:hypothetical protein
MKFNCGLTAAERLTNKIIRLEQWHPWFAWRPIRVDSKHCVWLEWMERKGRENTGYGGPWMYWDYREIP